MICRHAIKHFGFHYQRVLFVRFLSKDGKDAAFEERNEMKNFFSGRVRFVTLSTVHYFLR